MLVFAEKCGSGVSGDRKRTWEKTRRWARLCWGKHSCSSIWPHMRLFIQIISKTIQPLQTNTIWHWTGNTSGNKASENIVMLPLHIRRTKIVLLKTLTNQLWQKNKTNINFMCYA